MTLRSGSGQACAACKFQRRRCTPQCLLAPYFPADQLEVFQSVHKLFGVKHIQKLLKELHPDHRAMAIKSVKFHAAMRERNPVYGCFLEVHNLGCQIQLAEEELQAVLQQLLHYRQQQQQQQQETLPVDDYLSQSQLQLGMAPPGHTAMGLVQQDEHNLVTTGHGSSCSNNINGDHHYNKECNDIESLWVQQTYSYSNNNDNNNANSMVMQQSQITTDSQTMPAPQESVQDYNEMHSFFDNIDDRQSYIGPKEVYESSLDSSVRDCRQSDEQIAENELKNAAACFSLTSFH